MALFATLCLLSLLTLLCLSVVHATRRHGQLAGASFENIQQRELADSALRLSLLELGAPAPAAAANAVGPRRLDVFGAQVTVNMQFEAGRIDLNAADEFLLTAAFAGNGFSEPEARSMAARIIDWRDPDDSTTAEGAERDDYRRADRVHGPRNAPFETVAEVQQILGGEKIDAALLDAFTVYSQLQQVRQEVAAPTVINALRWAEARHLAGRTWWNDEAQPPLPGSQHSDLAGEVLQLQACAGDRRKTCRIAIVRFTGNRSDPVLVYLWR
jgi:general secretion pathway protein K